MYHIRYQNRKSFGLSTQIFATLNLICCHLLGFTEMILDTNYYVMLMPGAVYFGVYYKLKTPLKNIQYILGSRKYICE